MQDRCVIRHIRGMDTADGTGMKLERTIGQPGFDTLDPFLLLDEFRSDDADNCIAGFPEHPQRGFETVTCALADAAGPASGVAIEPLGETVARCGPFVANAPAGIHQASADFRAGKS